MLICKCFTITDLAIKKELESYYQSGQKLALVHLKEKFPFLTQCHDCLTDIQSIIAKNITPRQSSWHQRPNTFWIKKIHYACKQKGQLIDFYNAKVFMSCDGKNQEVIEKIINEEISSEIKVIFL